MNQAQSQPTHQFSERSSGQKPAGFWIRVVAYFIDSLIVSVIFFPINMGLTFLSASSQGTAESMGAMGLNYLISWIVLGCYAGYFYSQKGATPGKLVVNLKVCDAETGSHISFWKGFFRDSIGKMVSMLVFGIGYLMVAFRKDKAGLHDLMLNTRVWKKD